MRVRAAQDRPVHHPRQADVVARRVAERAQGLHGESSDVEPVVDGALAARQVRIADEVCLQMHLLNLSFGLAVRARAKDDDELATSICTKQLTGIAGVATDRIRRALDLPGDAVGLARVLEVHPLLNPAGYVVAEIEGGRLHVHPSPAHQDGSWISLCSPASVEPLQAIATAVDPHLVVHCTGTETDWIAEFAQGETAVRESVEVQVTKVSLGATFQFEQRLSLPLTVV